MYKNDLLKTIALSCVLLLTLFITGCNDDDDDVNDDSTEITVSASRTEGIAPLNVSFDVHGIDEADINSIYWDFGDGTVQSTSYLSDSFSVSHTYTTRGTHTVSALVYTWNDGVFAGQRNITVFPDVNLVVSSFAIDDEFTPGGEETISAIIQNIGDMALEGTGNVRVGYYLSTDKYITVDDIYIGDTSIVVGDYFLQSEIPFGFELLSPSENYQYNHQLFVKGNIPTGTYYAGAIVDYIDDYHWYDFPRLTDTEELTFPCPLFDPTECNSIIWETNEEDNSRLLEAHQVTVTNPRDTLGCIVDADDSSATASLLVPKEPQQHNFCDDNSDWFKFEAVQGNAYKIATSDLEIEVDTQLILYDKDARSILLFSDNMSNVETRDLSSGFPVCPDDCLDCLRSEIVWEAQSSGTYFIKARSTTCDEDLDHHCSFSPDGAGLDTGYRIKLQPEAINTDSCTAIATGEENPGINLIVASFAIDEEVTSGGIETISAIIQNIGELPLDGYGELHVGYYLSEDENITVEDIYIGDTSIVVGDYFLQSEIPFGFELLSSSENYQYNHQLFVKGNIPTGTYYPTTQAQSLIILMSTTGIPSRDLPILWSINSLPLSSCPRQMRMIIPGFSKRIRSQ
jgi:PKD repeat protein